jgi:hypothetical protein
VKKRLDKLIGQVYLLLNIKTKAGRPKEDIMKQIIDGKRYNTETAALVASDVEELGRNTYLFKTRKGRFFLHHKTRWQGERSRLEQISAGEAKAYYEELTEIEMDYAAAFGIEPEEA